MEHTRCNNERNVSIQILRIISCLLVFAVHFGQRIGLSGTIREFTDFGVYGVQFFFLISGFLAAKTFVGKNVDTKKYYLKRIIAILPMYFLVIVYYFITENILNSFTAVIPADELGLGWLRYIFLLNGFLNSDTYFWSNLGITWTIPIFMFFYLIAPWILKKIKGVFSATLVWAIVLAASKIIECFYTCSIQKNLHYLFLGVVIYCCTYNNVQKAAALIFQIGAIGSIIIGLYTFAYIFIFASIMLIAVSLHNLKLPHKLQQLVDVLDKYSYTFYLIQGVVFCSIIDRLNILEIPKILIAVIAISGTFVGTWLVGKFIEKPMQAFLTKKLIKN